MVRKALEDEESTVIPGSPEWRSVIARGDAVNAGDDDDGEQTPEDRVQRMLATISGGARSSVKLYRVLAGRKQWCGDYSPAAFEQSGLTAIREEWGPGEYEVVLYGERSLPTGKMHYGVRGRVMIEIATPTRPSVPAASSAQAPELIAALHAIAQSQAAILQALTQRPQVDPAEQMRQTFEMLKLAREAAAPVSAAPAPSSAMSEMMAAFRLMKEMSAEINPPAAPEDPLMAALPMVTQLLQQRQAPVEPFPQLAIPPSINQPAPQESQAPSEEGQSVSIAILRAQVNMLVDLASKGDETIEAGARLVYEKAPDEVLDMLGAPGWLDQLGLFVPGVLNHREWFEKVAAQTLTMLDDEEQGELPLSNPKS